DDPFLGDQYQRLVLGDDQIDERKKEIVICAGLDLANNAFKNCLRAQEDTEPLEFSTGAVVSGSARLPIVGLTGSGGQIVSVDPKNYFVTYDIDAQATVSPSANLGALIGARRVVEGGAELVLPNTGYFQLKAPKSMDASATSKVGVPVITPSGKTASFISNLGEIADYVRVVSTDAVDGPLGPFAQQKSTLAVASFVIQTDVSDALWRWMLVFATGTAAAQGAIASDVDLVSLWYDANGDAIFNPASDVMVGTGTFGNYAGLPLVAQVLLTQPITVVTPLRAPQFQRYFVAYHIAEGALPVDPLTNKLRTVAVELRSLAGGMGSLPSGIIPDDPWQNALAYPNIYDPNSPLPFTSKERTIIPSPQTFYVKSTPYFSNSSGTFPAPRLDPGGTVVPAQPVGTVDPFWILSSTEGLVAPTAQTTAYLMVDGEIVSYESIHDTMPRLVGVHRGELNSVPATHSTGAVAGPMLSQGSANVALLKLEAWTSAFQVQWSGVGVNRVLPAGLYGEDADISGLHLYKIITPDGLYHRDPDTGLDVGDIKVGSARFGLPPDTDGRATISVNDPTIGSPGYALITPTTSTFFLAADISPSAKFCHWQLNPPNEILGAAVPESIKFLLSPANAGHNAVLVTPAASPNYPIMPTVNLLTAVFDQISGNSAQQNSKNVPMLRVHAYTDRNSVLLQKLRFDRVGSNGDLDSDINLVKVWRDANGNGLFDVADSTRDVQGDYPNLLSYGNETFSSGTVNITLREPILVTTAPADYFVSYDVSQFASEGSRFGVAIRNPAYFTVQVPNSVAFTTQSFVTNPYVEVKKVLSRLTLGVYNLSADVVGVGQAQPDVGMLRFSLATDIALAPWRSLRVERTGGSPQDPTKPLGRNTNVKFVRVYKDINQDDVLTREDVNISEAETSLAVGISSAAEPPFDLVVMSTAGFPRDNNGDPVGGRIYINEAELMTFSGPG
ncbi:MAG: hypothetical protein PHF00_13480, partial [Elusimicrobia bacterium]|nr:hypothetical protein [Elusimicrobiota bacterium]